MYLSSVSSLGPSALLSETTRLPGQLCHPPTTHLATLHPTKNGCSSLKFSHSGRLLAAGCADNNDLYPVIIYEVRSTFVQHWSYSTPHCVLRLHVR